MSAVHPGTQVVLAEASMVGALPMAVSAASMDSAAGPSTITTTAMTAATSPRRMVGFESAIKEQMAGQEVCDDASIIAYDQGSVAYMLLEHEFSEPEELIA